MPTSAVAAVTWGRICSASCRHRASASRSFMAWGVQEGLQDDAGGGGVEHGLAFAPVGASGRGEICVGGDRGQAFVGGEHRQAEAAVELVCEAPAACGEFVFGAVEM